MDTELLFEKRSRFHISFPHLCLLPRGSTDLWLLHLFAYISILAAWWVQRSSLGSLTCVCVSMHVWVHEHGSQHVISAGGKRERERFRECKFLSSTFIFPWPDSERGRKKASQSFSYKAPLSFPSSPRLVSSPCTATLIPFSLPTCLWWDWFCRLGEYFMLWCYIQQFHSVEPLIRKKQGAFLLKEVKNPFICH